MLDSPSFKDFQITDLLMKVIAWRGDISVFFKDITGLQPRPFQDDFFREVQGLKSRNIVIVAGRGIGKTLAISIVGLWYVFVLSIAEKVPMHVVILGGSMTQAQICFAYIMEFVNKVPLLQQQLAKEPTQREVMFKDGSWIRPLPASEKSIRGHHPDLLIIDEAAQVEDEILIAALPLTAPSPYARQIFSTTPSTGMSFIEEKWENQAKFTYPDWKFFNWNAESFLPLDQVNLLKSMMPEDKYRSEIQGVPYKREGKVFRLSDLKECQNRTIKQEENSEIYAGVDWGYFPAPTVLLLSQRLTSGTWQILYSRPFLQEYSEEVLDAIQSTCTSYPVIAIYTDSTDKGENLRLAARGLPVQPVSFKGEKGIMLSNLRMLVEQHKIQFDPMTQQPLIGQMIDYVYDSVRNDDFVDALMLSVKANPISQVSWSITDLLREGVTRKRGITIQTSDERKSQIRARLQEIGRI